MKNGKNEFTKINCTSSNNNELVFHFTFEDETNFGIFNLTYIDDCGTESNLLTSYKILKYEFDIKRRIFITNRNLVIDVTGDKKSELHNVTLYQGDLYLGKMDVNVEVDKIIYTITIPSDMSGLIQLKYANNNGIYFVPNGILRVVDSIDKLITITNFLSAIIIHQLKVQLKLKLHL